MSRDCWHCLTWGIHRALCVFGIHAAEKIFSWSALDPEGSTDYSDPNGEFVERGRFCPVCHKHWEKDNG